jgi:hypothetical protein
MTRSSKGVIEMVAYGPMGMTAWESKKLSVRGIEFDGVQWWRYKRVAGTSCRRRVATTVKFVTEALFQLRLTGTVTEKPLKSRKSSGIKIPKHLRVLADAEFV